MDNEYNLHSNMNSYSRSLAKIADAFDRLVTVIEKAYEKEYDED